MPKPENDLPRAFPSMWRAMKRAYQAEPRMLLVSFSLAMAFAVPDALIALWLKLLADGITGKNRTLAIASALALGISATATWFLKVTSDRTLRRFRECLTIYLESHVAKLQASIATIAHHERPDYLDRLAMLRDQVFVLDHMYMSLFMTCGWILRLGVTIVLLVSIHPALGFLALFALPTVLTSSWRPGIERTIEERGTSAKRLARHLFNTATTAPPGKEVRVTRIGERLVRDRRDAWERWYRPVAATRWSSARWHALAWAIFGAGYVGAVVFVSSVLRASAGQVLLVLAAGSRLSAYIGAAVGEIGFLRGIWLDGSRRLAWLEDYAAAMVEKTDKPAPINLTQGIRFEHVSFTYPGTTRRVLEDVNVELKPGSVVAIVGQNGAGKTTLVKLLCKLYEPNEGRILIGDTDLARIRTDEWRSRLAGAFQDFFKFELKAKETVGVGDLPQLESEPAIAAAVNRAGADDVVEKFAEGLHTQLGTTWPGGVEVSFGQWQKLALARGFMRNEPLVLVLDEPTAALDAETEHALFERYASATRGSHITILVSHRFSTVRMADQIVVLDGSRVVECGSHEQLLAKGGQYAELYEIQAAAYR